ncbi:prefoldin subunit 4 [Thecamonas trahens ATCC 50062]|uniref:Prefoldin subunit 4 n=1 Tax=Thecamonas trahens ATCC 50062 TaxID=461836 RepID=A0A0L0D4P0_THETB|nr:prefoldin subunit 4 [Thecamonas trahens ATCC 50062]KNC47284.1 prefoldin subunit 4 [Thecamonas trahens ATCC 50062]|eukprot:XP_013759626.1 prefoldin subunit 4 [Thecamonas trahens ATCC 50062]
MQNARLLKKEDEVDVDVNWEDQQRINKFGRLNQRVHELEADIGRWQEELDNLEDASTEVLMADDDDALRFQIGEVFVMLPADEVEARIEALQEETEAKVTAAEAEIETLREALAELKVVLYGKFKNSINLEES